MKKPSATPILLGTILIFSLLINGVCIVAAEDSSVQTNDNSTPTPDYQMFSWALLLPIFFGCFLFLGWMCRFFEEMSYCFALFMHLLPAVILILVTILFHNFIENFIKDFIDGKWTWLFYVILFIIVLIYSAYVFLKSGSQNRKNKNIESQSLENINIETKNKEYINVENQSIENKNKENKNKEIKNISKLFLNRVRSLNIILLMLIWPVILIYFYICEIKYVSFSGIPGLTFPVYVITASFIGVLSYLLLSIEDTFGELIPEYKKLSIAWSYLRRIFIAPFIAIIGFYLLFYLQNKPDGLKDINDHFVFVFSFFTGVFTKTIEGWIYKCVQDILPRSDKKDYDSRVHYEVKESELVKKLGLDEDLVYLLYDEKIRKIEDLANRDPSDITKRVNAHILYPDERGRYTEEQIKKYIDKAKGYLGIDKSELVTTLKMDKDLAEKLYAYANIKTIKDLSKCNKECIHNRLIGCNEEVDESVIEKYINSAKEYMNVVNGKLVTVLRMDKDLAFKLYTCAQIDTIEKLNEKNEEDIRKSFTQRNEEVDVKKITKYKEMAEIYKDIGNSEFITKQLTDNKDLVFKLAQFAQITKIDDLKDKRWEYVSNSLGVCCADITRAEIEAIMEKARNQTGDKPPE